MARYVRSVDLGSGPGLRFRNAPRYGEVGAPGGFAEGMSIASLADELAIAEEGKFDVEGITKANIKADSLVNRAIDDANTNAFISSIQGEALIERAKNAADDVSSSRDGSLFGKVLGVGLPLIGSALMSDESTKNTIQDIENALQMLRELRPVSYYYNEEYSARPERLHYGFVAQEYQKVMPDATYFDEDVQKLCIDPVELIGILVRAVQELDIKVKRLEAAKALQTI